LYLAEFSIPWTEQLMPMAQLMDQRLQ